MPLETCSPPKQKRCQVESALAAKGMRLLLFLALVAGSPPASAISFSCSEWLSSRRHTAFLRQVHAHFDKENFYWQFPSDHLPVAGVATLESTGENLRVITWNVLNPNYMDMIVNGTQGLQKSEITALEDRRPRLIAVFNDLMFKVRPDVVALQEVDAHLLSMLRAWARKYGYEVTSVPNPSGSRTRRGIDNGVIVYSPYHLEMQPGMTRIRSFAGPNKYIQQVGFRTRKGATFLFTNVHRAYSDYETLKNYFLNSGAELPLIMAGDLNYSRAETAAFVGGIPNLSMMNKVPGDFTHIDTSRELVDYDHILFTPGVRVESRASLNMKIKQHFAIR